MKIDLHSLKPADWPVVLANLVPVIGVWFWGWSAKDAFIVYAMETLIAGIITIVKMLIITLYRKKHTWYNQGKATPVSGYFFIFFFIIHFGLFAAVQTSIFSESANIARPGSGPLYFFFHWYQFINQDIAAMLSAFVLSYLIRSFVPFIIHEEYKTIPLMFVMFQPYGRIVIQQITVILGSMFLSLGFDKGFILVFAFAKIFFDVFVNFDRLLERTMKAEEEKIKNDPV